MSAGFLAGMSISGIAAASGGAAVISDSVFDDANWIAFELLDTTPKDTFVITAGQESGGGNPAEYRRLIHFSTSTGSVSLISGHLFNGATFDPGEDGAIASIDFTMDGISIDSDAGAVGYGAMIRQDDIVFTFGLGAAINGAGWDTLSATELTAEDFIGWVENEPNPDLHPDFSSSGSPIEFGFVASNGTYGNSTNEGGADNWAFTIHPAACIGDIDNNGAVDTNDLLILLASWGGPGGDLNDDDFTDVADLLLLIAAWGAC